ELGYRAGEQVLAKIEVGEDALERIVLVMVRRGREQGGGDGGPMPGGGHAEFLLASEMVKERTLRHARRPAQVVDGGGRVALLAHDLECGVEDAFASARTFGAVIRLV